MSSSKRTPPSRTQLLDRWRDIQEDEDLNDDDDPLKRRRLQTRKEQWFADAFNFVVSLPEDTHIWCGSPDVMGPLLETFYNYSKDQRPDSPLRLLWRRLSSEMRHCVHCSSQHHHAQHMYLTDYDSSSVGPLLDVLRTLDEERLTQHLAEINATLKKDQYDPLRDNDQVVSLMYEVLMFPALLDDQSLLAEFELFIEQVDNMHDLALAANQQFPGVYALLFLNRRVRTIGRRLARAMDKLRGAADLEPLQPLLGKFIGLLETDVLPSASKNPRPRIQLDRLSVWLGITSLLEFLEPPAFEEGILERYPIFFDIVLNHVSGDSDEFSHAVNCLKELFKMLEVLPVQSLEALQDGEHEKQRRHFIFFLLHQVPVSSNFNILARKMACKTAFLIIHRGYKMNPPCPPYECAHMWAPSLVSSLKDSSLHSSLRQPAFDLIQTIIVSDAAALVASLLNILCTDRDVSLLSVDDNNDNDGLPFALCAEEKDNICWNEFNLQSKVTFQGYREWMCIPMLWIDVLVDIDPSVLPVSFSKAVFWARSHLTMVEPETSAADMVIPVRNWLSSSAAEISPSFGWKVATGFDDGGCGKESKNAVKVSILHLPLIKTFNRLSAHFLVQVGQGEIRKLWTWEPKMAESLILSLLDPNDHVRQFGKCILEQVSSTRGLSSGLKFLCSNKSSMAAMFQGLRHALRVVQLDAVISKFQILQHLFFVLYKLIKGGDSINTDSPDKSSNTKYSSQGGFLMQPVLDSVPVKCMHVDSMLESQRNFSSLLAEIAWPSIRKCLIEGKEYIDYSLCQMTCVRVLEVLPIVFERLGLASYKHFGNSGKTLENVVDFLWLHDLVDWGKSSLKVVVVYWKRAVTSLLKLLQGSCSSTSALRSIEDLILCDSIDIDQLMEQVSRLRVSLSKAVSSDVGVGILRPKGMLLEGLSFPKQISAATVQPCPVQDRVGIDKGVESSVIILSDDESERQLPPAKVTPSNSESVCRLLDTKKVADTRDGNDLGIDTSKKICGASTSGDVSDVIWEKNAPDITAIISKQEVDKSRGNPIKLKVEDGKTKAVSFKDNAMDSFSHHKMNLKKFSDESVNCKVNDQASNNTVSGTRDSILKGLVSDVNSDLPEPATKSAKQHQAQVSKISAAVPKRQVIQLQTPLGNRFGNLQKQEARAKRFKPPRLDDWYRPVLEIDYFAIVGLASASDDKRTVSRLKQVPVCFQSPEQYVEIFQPLVLEEFKAQLHSSFLEMSSWDDVYYGTVSVLSVERIDDFHLVRFVHDDDDSTSSSSFSENDLVLLTKKHPQKSSHDVHMVGKVERRERDFKRRSSILLIRFYFLNGSSRLNQARQQLIDRSKWHASRIMSLTPQLREFQALSSLKDIPIISAILGPPSDSYKESREPSLCKLSQPLQQVLKSSFNESQLQAISVAIGLPDSRKGFEISLIQGPPGTGKTRTIVAIVSGLLTSLKGTNDAKYPLNRPMQQGNSSCTNTRTKISQSVAISRAWQDAALARQISEDAKRDEKSVESSTRRRVLICAQSNAAVDELVARICSEGLYGNDGKMYKPYLVRVGNAKTIHPNSLPFFIDTLVDHRLAEERMHPADAKKDWNTNSSTLLRSNLEKLVESIRFYEAKRANLQDGNSGLKNPLEDDMQKGDDAKEMSDAELAVKLRKLYEQKKQIFKELSAAQVQEKKSNEEHRAQKHKLRKAILREAEIVVTTLSGCGGDLFGVCSESMSSSKFGNPSEHTLFDAVVIDEAAQALEPATLIPLQLLKSNSTKCIMVGDPKQLPATVLSNVASKFLYECSMFERLQKAGHSVTMLTKQARRKTFYLKFLFLLWLFLTSLKRLAVKMLSVDS
ncbi:hypothetical protein Tsubulata_023786 [Turnera subulata]|uniref:DNA2/NAM7 helicase helicase domain-containing protein n=1 Tax=Turnera subulata TaxID=218843 RepID=A0A9Q0F7L8_9ROSI|nr:hypothetical protein Tsubulata_023786 [Turnera subulata]